MIRICVTGGAGQIAYSLLFRLASGEVFGDQSIALYIRDLPEMEKVLEGVAMELEDCAFPRLREIKIGSDPHELFDQVDIALLVGAKPRGQGMERSDLLEDNGKIFIEEGRALNDAAKTDVKVIVVGNPCNTNCLIAMHYAPKIPKQNFHAMMRLDQNRAAGLLAKRAGLPVAKVSNVVIWGNHSASQVPDYLNAKIDGKPATDVIHDKEWLQQEFMNTVQKRGAAVIQARGKSSAASAANGAIDALHSLFKPTQEGDWFTTAVSSDHNPYGIEGNLVFGFPCRSTGDGNYEIVPGLNWDFFIREKIALTQKELLSERECVQKLLKKK